MDLKKIPFEDFESKKPYSFSTFKERNIDVRMLNEIDASKKVPSGNFYKFGVFENGKYYWFFDGRNVANNRFEMLKIFYMLSEAFKNTESIPFVYKVKRT